MRTAAALLAAFTLLGPAAPRRAPFSDLKTKMETVARDFHGALGYSLRHDGAPDERLSFRGDEAFPSASTIKTALLCEALHQVEQGKRKWDEPVTVQPGTASREEGGFAYYFKDGSALPLSEWLH